MEKLPIRITIIATFLGVCGAWSLFRCLSSSTVFHIPFASPLILVAIGLFRGRSWSRIVTLLLIGIGYFLFSIFIGMVINSPEHLTFMVGSTPLDGADAVWPTVIYSAWGIATLAWMNYSLCMPQVKSFFAEKSDSAEPAETRETKPEFQI